MKTSLSLWTVIQRGHSLRPSRIHTRALATSCPSPSLKSASFFFHNAQWGSRLPSLSSGPLRMFSPSLAKQAVDPSLNANVAPSGGNVRPVCRLEQHKQAEVLTLRRLLNVYAQLSKSRLTALIVLTAMGGVALSPLPTSVPVLLATAVGTMFCSASANTLNQIQEAPFDAQMARTRMRPLVRRAIGPVHATSFAIVTGVAGPVLLWTMVNSTTAILGIANIALYAGLYTWMKRVSIWNTWLGAIVGAIPPLMGWTACGGQLLPQMSAPAGLSLPSFMASSTDIALLFASENSLAPLAPLALFMVLFSWQFPHFNALSHLVRESYAQAGYRMLSVIDPVKNRLVALRHAVLFIPICSLLVPLSGLTTWAFALTSLVPNLICIRAAWRFWKGGSEKEAKAVFQHSLWFLPALLGLMMFHKQGMDWSAWTRWGNDTEETVKAEDSNLKGTGSAATDIQSST